MGLGEKIDRFVIAYIKDAISSKFEGACASRSSMFNRLHCDSHCWVVASKCSCRALTPNQLCGKMKWTKAVSFCVLVVQKLYKRCTTSLFVTGRRKEWNQVNLQQSFVYENRARIRFRFGWTTCGRGFYSHVNLTSTQYTSWGYSLPANAKL